MSSSTLQLDADLHAYLLEVGVREPDILRRLRVETSELPQAGMQISPEQGQLMRWLVGALGVRRIVEVGTFTGYSALSMAMALPDDGLLVACDISEGWTAIARRYWEEAGLDDRIDLRLGPALETLAALEDCEVESFDFAFIDADKTHYAAYYERLLSLLRVGGTIAFDNMLWGGAVVDESNHEESTEAIRALNRALHQDERVEISMIPIGDGLMLARKR